MFLGSDGGNASDTASVSTVSAAVRGEGGGGRAGRAAPPLVVLQPRLQAPRAVRDSVRLQRDKRSSSLVAIKMEMKHQAKLGSEFEVMLDCNLMYRGEEIQLPSDEKAASVTICKINTESKRHLYKQH